MARVEAVAARIAEGRQLREEANRESLLLYRVGADEAFLRAMAKDNLAFQEAARRKLELLRAELLGPSPSPVERVLAERVAAC